MDVFVNTKSVVRVKEALSKLHADVDEFALFIQHCVRVTSHHLVFVLDSHDLYNMFDWLYATCQGFVDEMHHTYLKIDIRFKEAVIGPEYAVLVPESSVENPEGLKQSMANDIPVQWSLSPVQSFPRVLFAGTFDHLHCGHKSVLTRSLLIATDILYVGITTRELLVRKNCPAAIESFALRELHVMKFLEEVMLSLGKCIQLIALSTSDPIGPARLLNFDALVVTEESQKGGAMVNEARSLAGTQPVEIIVIPILADRPIQDKHSSSSIRTTLCRQLPLGEADLMILHQSFKDATVGVDPEVGETIWCVLRDNYGMQPWRRYHNLRHVRELLGGLTTVPKDSKFILTLWYHDAVHFSRDQHNEAESVQLLESHAHDLNIAPDLLKEIRDTILLTKCHRESLRLPLQRWQKEFLELDLSILGATEARYKEYAGQIRTEYMHMSNDEFVKGRKQFLSSWLDFNFEFIPQSHELNERLQENINWEISTLST